MDDLKQKAIAYHQNGKFNEAEILYNKILSTQEDAHTSYLLGAIYYAKGRHILALQLLQNAINKGFNSPAAFSCLRQDIIAPSPELSTNSI